MNKITITAVLLLFLKVAPAQETLSKEAIKDFANATYITYLYNDNFRLRTNFYFYSLKKKDEDAQKAIKTFTTNQASRNLIFKSLGDRLLHLPEDYIAIYLANDMGVESRYAKEISHYLHEKFYVD